MYSKLCYLLITLASVVMLFYGLRDILQKRKNSETDNIAVISRQIRGFGILMLAQIMIIVGGSLCMGLSGGVTSLTSYIRKM